MHGELSEQQMNNVLVSQAIGRIGFITGKRPNIIPVTYVFNDKFIYGQTNEGLKLSILRKNPVITFQVDIIVDLNNWQSVMLHGMFKELKGVEADEARELLYKRVLPLSSPNKIHPHEHDATANIDDKNRIKSVMYSIKIIKKSGRYQKQ